MHPCHHTTCKYLESMCLEFLFTENKYIASLVTVQINHAFPAGDALEERS